MTWLRKLSAIVLLAIWLPVTSHCALEMAGLLPTDDCCANDSSGHCAKDNCDELESNLIKPSAESTLVKGPMLWCACLICAVAAIEPRTDLMVARVRVPIDFSDDWVPGWSFEHRTALPARAPSLS
jgi:hypothetical protein